MKRGDTIQVDDIGTLLIHTVNGDYVKGTWQSGVLKGRKAGCSRRALEGKDAGAPAPPSRKSTKRARMDLFVALLADLQAGPVAIAPWAQKKGCEETAVRGTISALRRAGESVVALGGGKFGLQGTKVPRGATDELN